MLSLVQFGLSTLDMAASLRLYAEAFGFRNAGGQALWGETIRIQGLAPDSRAIMWWLVGAQDFFQLELFQHSRPAQRPLPENWRPCDLGWVRFGVAVADYDTTLAAIDSNGLALSGQAVGPDGLRRCAFRDPWVGCCIEVREAQGGDGPELLYATSSVSDLDGARRYYHEILGFPLLPLELLHRTEDETLWGLPGARREGFLVDTGQVLLEVVHYLAPQGQPRRADHRASDQGFFNVALGSRQTADVRAAIGRLRVGGVEPERIFDTGELLAAYVNAAEREVEFCVLPEGMDAALGLEAREPFFG
ncbi:hypothetical protein E4634_17115 [Mangrovimicrobium sediminis]|uniref:VOC domain-containing protein n=1 Tax=Mangrovimicrobium sediminis TaxID=2562682 RepID=A0A4Z0LWP6_9GAMM|nr:hypothetical protein [Haliea sp. SAOS-164]TGD71833.1 hypothetical protein E4634_17115 [Haliea sp. SAOS-164]